MTDQIKNALIAIFFFSAVGIFIFVVFFLHPQIGDEGQIIYVRFSNVDKVTVGTRVTFAGRPVGEVVEIREINVTREEELHGGYIYSYELVLVIDSGIKVYNTDEVSLRTSGLLGERTIAITPRYPKKGVKLKRVTSEDIIFAKESGSLEDTFAGFGEFSQKAEDAFEALSEQLDEIKKEEIWKHLGSTVRNLDSITTALNLPDEWSTLLKSLTKFSKRLNKSLDKADKALDHLASIGEEGHKTVRHINEGKGTLGQLLVSDDLYLRFVSLLSKGETLMDDINHYGLLFQNDKGWQRLRARRRNLLEKLCSPQEFRNFFQDEVNMISTSLCRVYEVLRKTECALPCCDLLADPRFAHLFTDLLMRIEGLEANIKCYDQQLVEVHNKPGVCKPCTRCEGSEQRDQTR